MNPNPSNIGSEGKNFTAWGNEKAFRDLYYSHYDDFRFQFEDSSFCLQISEFGFQSSDLGMQI